MFLYGLLGTTYIIFYYLCVVYNNLIVKYQLCLNKLFSVSVSVSVSFTVIHCHSLSFTVIHCHSLSFTVIHCHSLSFTVIHCHSLSFTVIHCHSLSFFFRRRFISTKQIYKKIIHTIPYTLYTREKK